jgi:transposase
MTLMDEAGKVLKAEKVINFRREVEEFLEGSGDEVKAVIEAGRSIYTMVELLEELGVEVVVAHPSDVKAIARAKIKTDKRDSKTLAHLLRTDLIPEVYRRDKENREAQRILRQRMFFVRERTRVKNRIATLLAQQQEEILSEIVEVKDLFTRKGIELMKALNLPDTDKKLLDGLFKIYWHIEERINESDDLVKRLYTELPEAKLIDTIPGFGVFFSVLTAIEIADVERFESAGKLHCYVGVIPSTHSSGERTYHGKIIKAGNKWLRWVMVEAVQPACRKDFDIRLYYNRHARRKNNNVAKVATARKLLTIVYRVLKERREYEPYKRKVKRNYSVAFHAS